MPRVRCKTTFGGNNGARSGEARRHIWAPRGVIDPQRINMCVPGEELLSHDEHARKEVKGLCECPEAFLHFLNGYEK